MDWHSIRGVFPPRTQCSWDRFQGHRDPNLDKVLTEGEWTSDVSVCCVYRWSNCLCMFLGFSCLVYDWTLFHICNDSMLIHSAQDFIMISKLYKHVQINPVCKINLFNCTHGISLQIESRHKKKKKKVWELILKQLIWNVCLIYAC